MKKIQSCAHEAGTRAPVARLWATLLCLGLSLGAPALRAQGVAVANPYDQTRTSSFTYYGASDGAKNGLLKTETVEPDSAQLCVTTTHDYDAYGNKVSVSTSNCANASGKALFTSRGSSSDYAARAVTMAGTNVTPQSGAFPTTSTNALAQSETKTYDPRFGAVVQLTGPNGLSTSWDLDDFGRKTREIRADGTRTLVYYCYIAGRVSDLSSNTPGCPTPGPSEIPADAVSFVHTETRDNTGTLGNLNGSFVRVYVDRAGRQLRSVSEAFDGPSQAGGSSRLIVQDTDYSALGYKTVATQPYFLDTGSSLGNGGAAYGMSPYFRISYATDLESLREGCRRIQAFCAELRS